MPPRPRDEEEEEERGDDVDAATGKKDGANAPKSRRPAKTPGSMLESEEPAEAEETFKVSVASL